MANRNRISRRQFVSGAGSTLAGLTAAPAIALPWFVPASSLGLGGTVPPSDRITMAAIGCGGKGRHNTGEFLKIPGVQFLAVCDVDRGHATADQQQVQAHYGNTDCRAFGDFREMLADVRPDAVHVSTPDHWHALASVAAMHAGCDVYCEKPLANSVAEAIAIRNASRSLDRIVQTGSHERSNPKIRQAVALAREGRLGKIRRIEVNMPCGDDWHHREVLQWKGQPQPEPVPDGLDWDLWQGPAAEAPYHARRCHFWWRFILAYGGGEMTDRGAHILDIAQWVLGADDSGPELIQALGTRDADNLYDAFMSYEFELRYLDGTLISGANREPRGLRLVTDEGSLFIHIHGGDLEVEPAGWIDPHLLEPQANLPGHHEDFLQSVRNRSQPIAPASAGCRTASLCHLVNIAMLTGRPLRWDPAAEAVNGDNDAHRLLSPPFRPPWQLPS